MSAPESSRPLLLFFVQHLLGIGHLHRALRIAAACCQRGFRVCLISGGAWPESLELSEAIELVQLPPLQAADSGFSGLATRNGQPPDTAYWEARRQILIAQTERQPDVVLFELFPFRRRQLRHELIAWLQALHQLPRRPLCISSVRDILVRKSDAELARQREETMQSWFERYFDYALIHGDPALVPFEHTFPPATKIAARLCYTGLVCPPAPPARARRGIVVSCGGGAVGARLLETALAAQQIDDLGEPWEIYTGPNLADTAFRALPRPAGVSVERFHPDFCRRLAGARISLSQAGYNTVADLLVARTPAVLVPFAEGGESEQPLRAELMARAGRAIALEETALSPERLLEALRSALRCPAIDTQPFNLDGATASAEQLWQWQQRH